MNQYENCKRNTIKSFILKFLNRETISYLFFGVLTTLINIGCYRFCTLLGIVYWFSNIIAWVAGVAFAFITNKLFVFESKTMQATVVFKEAVSFIAARLFSGLCDLGFMIFAVEIIHMNDFIAKLITNVFVVVLNYLFSKLIVFKNKSN